MPRLLDTDYPHGPLRCRMHFAPADYERDGDSRDFKPYCDQCQRHLLPAEVYGEEDGCQKCGRHNPTNGPLCVWCEATEKGEIKTERVLRVIPGGESRKRGTSWV